MHWLPRIVLRTLTPGARRAVDGLTEGLYPPSDGAVDAEEAEMAERTWAWVTMQPPWQHMLLVVLFTVVDWLPVVMAPLGGRLSSRPPADRLAFLERLDRSPLYPLQLLADAVMTALQMVYLSHPAVLRRIGEYKPFEEPAGQLDMDVVALSSLGGLHDP